ncbi:MAG TPA: hypothetical protein VJL28_15155 [Gemmatimonadaceae bacterium]|nr:hypothetical protein [Gemmatimonadaceae bacterium]
MKQIRHPYVFFWFDDAFLDASVDEGELIRTLRWAIEHDADYLRLRDVPKPAERVTDNIGRLVEGVPYRNTCFAALWRREVFLRLLQDGESAGQFEMEGTRRSDAYPRFYGVYRRPFEYLHGVVRGTWLRSTLRELVASSDVRSVERPVMSARQEAIWRVNEIKGSAIAKLPPGWAERLFKLKRAFTGPRR